MVKLVASEPFSAVHRGVGSRDQLFEKRLVLAGGRVVETGARGADAGGDSGGGRRDGPSHLGGQQISVAVHRGAGQEELLATASRHDRLVFGGGQQRLGNLNQRVIPRRVAAIVVEGFEVVQVDEQHHEVGIDTAAG